MVFYDGSSVAGSVSPHLSLSLSFSLYLSVCLYVCLSVCLSVYLSVYLYLVNDTFFCTSNLYYMSVLVVVMVCQCTKKKLAENAFANSWSALSLVVTVEKNQLLETRSSGVRGMMSAKEWQQQIKCFTAMVSKGTLLL